MQAEQGVRFRDRERRKREREMASYPWFTDYGLLYGGIYGIPIDRNGNLQSTLEDDHQAWYVLPCHHRSITSGAPDFVVVMACVMPVSWTKFA